jgi:hypothetical protein
MNIGEILVCEGNTFEIRIKIVIILEIEIEMFSSVEYELELMDTDFELFGMYNTFEI